MLKITVVGYTPVVQEGGSVYASDRSIWEFETPEAARRKADQMKVICPDREYLIIEEVVRDSD